jgi:anaerobic selenocysteine-containing dehydrogenase
MARATLPSICRFCHANCGILVEVEDGRAVRVTGDRANPAYHGFTCAKGASCPRCTRTRIGCSLAEARRAGRFRADRERAGDRRDRRADLGARRRARAALGRALRRHLLGPHPATIPFAIGWLLAAGSRMVFTAGDDRSARQEHRERAARALARGLERVRRVGRVAARRQQPADLDVGRDPAREPARRLRAAKERGMKLVVIDPRQTEVARFADVYLQPRPGEDPTLLAALLHVVIRDGLVRPRLRARPRRGLRELEAAVAPFTPQFAAERAGVPTRRSSARRTCSAGARAAAASRAPDRTWRRTEPHRVPAALPEHRVRALAPRGRARRESGRAAAARGAGRAGAGAAPRVRLRREAARARAREQRRGLPTAALADEILEPGEGRIRALICVGSNPIAAWPDQHKTRRAMDALDLLVTLDMKLRRRRGSRTT